MSKSLITPKMAIKLWNLGFRELCCRFAYKLGDDYIIADCAVATNWKECEEHYPQTIPVPTVDETIDWLRKKYDIIICNKADPYVCPKTGKIQFGYTIKKCYPKGGWNMRRYIGISIWSANIYAAKRDAIRKAISWIKKEKKDAEHRRASKTRRRGIRGKKNANR